jgi:hypothetical protein
LRGFDSGKIKLEDIEVYAENKCPKNCALEERCIVFILGIYSRVAKGVEGDDNLQISNCLAD